jgi:hypothetical protein
VDGTGAGLCLLLHVGVNSVETLGCCPRELISEVGLWGKLWGKEVNGSGSGLYMVCLKHLVDGTRKQTKQKIQTN